MTSKFGKAMDRHRALMDLDEGFYVAAGRMVRAFEEVDWDEIHLDQFEVVPLERGWHRMSFAYRVPDPPGTAHGWHVQRTKLKVEFG